MNDALECKAPRSGQDSPTERQHTIAAKLTERRNPGTASDRAGNALGQEQPPRDDVPVPGVDDDLYVLVQQIAVADVERRH